MKKYFPRKYINIFVNMSIRFIKKMKERKEKNTP